MEVLRGCMMSVAEKLIDQLVEASPRGILTKLDKLPGGKFIPVKKDKSIVGADLYRLTMKGNRVKAVKDELERMKFKAIGKKSGGHEVYDGPGGLEAGVKFDNGRTRVYSAKRGPKPGIPMD